VVAIDADDKRLLKDTKIESASMERWILKYYGKPCKDYCKGCVKCDVWKDWKKFKKRYMEFT
jgi:hypothetical protein